MAEPAETLLKILETLTHSQERLIETLERLEARQLEHSRFLAQFIDESLRRLSAQIAESTRVVSENSRALGEILERVVHTTDRTEQMTACILAEIGRDRGH